MMMDLAATHQPWLSLAVIRTTGKIAEFGMGHYSTPLLNSMAEASKRELVSFETDVNWMLKFVHLHHRKLLVPYYPSFDFEKEGPFDVALVDSAPGEYRIEIVKRLKGRCKFIVCHDTEADIPPSSGAYGWAKLDGLFKYETTFKQLNPWTTVFSDEEKF